MKKLVCARDIEECGKQGKTEYCVDGDTIITPSAKDAAEAMRDPVYGSYKPAGSGVCQCVCGNG